MLTDEFTAAFRAEHRQIRDILLELMNAFQNRDKPRIQRLLEQLARDAGPHFRYEEEALYPAVAQIMGRNYVEELLWDHDYALAASARLAVLACQQQLSQQEVLEAIAALRSMLLHTSRCDGLAIVAEQLPDEKIRSIISAHARAVEAGLPLVKWAAEVRERLPEAPM